MLMLPFLREGLDQAQPSRHQKKQGKQQLLQQHPMLVRQHSGVFASEKQVVLPAGTLDRGNFTRGMRLSKKTQGEHFIIDELEMAQASGRAVN